MEKYTYRYTTADFDADLEGMLDEDALLFDIETTGLSRDWCSVYLIGCGYRCGEDVTVKLIFAPTPADEPDTLSAFFELAKNFTSCITFNGEGFDIPFIRARAKMHGLDCEALNNLRSVDLMKITKKFSKHLNTPNCKQKTIEQYYGLFRKDIYNGGQLIDIYKEYTKRPTPEMLETLLLHNHEDIKGMMVVLNILELDMIKNATKQGGRENNAADVDDHSMVVGRGIFDRPPVRTAGATQELMYKLEMPLHQDIIISDSYYDIAIKKDGITVILHPFEGELRHFYKNYKDYCYIPDEDLLIPKSLASTIDKSRIEKATKENCCTKHTGSFLPVTDAKGHVFFDPGDAVTFKKDYADKQLFIEIDIKDIGDGFATAYIVSLLHAVV